MVKPDSQIDFLDGINFGFPPADIAHFLKQSKYDSDTRRREFDARTRQEQKPINLIGKTPGWIIAPPAYKQIDSWYKGPVFANVNKTKQSANNHTATR